MDSMFWLIPTWIIGAPLALLILDHMRTPSTTHVTGRSAARVDLPAANR